MTIDTTKLERIAFATSASHGASRWTELALYYRKGERRPFVATSIGKTRIAGEQEFERQRVTKTLESALQHFDQSRLTDDLRVLAALWEDSRDVGGVPAPRIGFDGAGGLLGALRWLYADQGGYARGAKALAPMFADDFGIDCVRVDGALENEREGLEPTPWCKAFIGALQHFDREAFQDARRVEA